MTKPTEHTDVAIVGCGPVGALLANLLGRRGRTVTVIEREPAIVDSPRAVHFDGEAMRIFQAAGLAAEVAAVARPSTKGMHFVAADGRTLMIRRGLEGPGPHGFAANWYTHQPHLEAVLRAGAAQLPGVDVRLGHEVVAVEAAASGDGARLAVVERASGREGSIRARFVVGCDGARSLVRRAIGSTHADLGLHQPWLVVDILTDPASPRVRALPEHTVQHCDPARPATAVYVGGNRRRWEIMLLPGDDVTGDGANEPPDGRRLPVPAMTDPARFWPLLARWIGPGDGTVERAAVYTFHALIAEGWRRGPLLLAGDACHQTPPFLGQGLCAGLRDAANLAWKLDLVLSGAASAALLDSYEAERRPHVEAFIGLAVELGAMIQTTDPAIAAARDRRFAGGAHHFDYPVPQLGPGVRAAGPPPVGQVFPQPRLADGRLLDEATEGRFALLALPSLADALEPRLAADLARLGVTIVRSSGSDGIADWLARHGAGAVLIRPDAYVFGLAAGSAAVPELAAHLARSLAGAVADA